MIKVLLVDDSDIFRAEMKKHLSTLKDVEIVEECVDGLDAITFMKRTNEKIDVIFLDITMPQIDGITAVSELKKLSLDTKIVMVSIIDQKKKVFEALNNGADHFIVKPVTPLILAGVIEMVCQSTIKMK